MCAIGQKDWEGINAQWPEKYRFGHTKLFFKAGVIGMLEEFRDDKISAILTALQTRMRFNLCRVKFLKTRKERDAAEVIQANFRAFDKLKTWEWMQLMYKIKPLVEQRDNAKVQKILLFMLTDFSQKRNDISGQKSVD